MSNRIPAYYEFARVAFLKILAYRLRYFTGILTYFINVTVYYFIWRAIYVSSESVAGYDLPQMVTYVAVGWMIRSFYYNNIDRDMAADVVEGRIATNLVRPVDTQLMYISQTVGEACFRAFMFTLPISAVLLLVYPVRPPASVAAAFLFAASCAFSLLILALINFVVGTFALRIQSILGIIRAKYFVVEFTSGLLIPLSFFPEKLHRFMMLLPFPHISYSPLQIYLGKVQGLAALSVLLQQALWAICLFFGGRVWWSVSARRLSIQGG